MNFTYNHGTEQAEFERWAVSHLSEIKAEYNELPEDIQATFDNLEDFAAALYFQRETLV